MFVLHIPGVESLLDPGGKSLLSKGHTMATMYEDYLPSYPTSLFRGKKNNSVGDIFWSSKLP
jgi:hypothetical protein